ncbi:MAG: hypothetical protein ACOVMR_06465 [Flavobacteriales bacterium]|jgi:hypothetical protein
MKYLSILSICAILFTSCGHEEKVVFTSEEITLSAEGPLFEGSNTLQGSMLIDLNKIKAGTTAENVESVKIKSVKLTSTDSLMFNEISNITLQCTSNDASMIQSAVLNPVPEGASSISLIPSAEADLVELFKQKEMLFVADAELRADKDGNISYKAVVEFELTLKD